MPKDFYSIDEESKEGTKWRPFRRWGFTWKEVILASIALVLLVTCLVLAILYATADDDDSDVKSNKGNNMNNSSGSNNNSSVDSMDKQYCISRDCLIAASRTQELMNTSVDPCEDFYQYACGNYKNVITPSFGSESRSVSGDIFLENEARLRAVLIKPIDRSHEGSAERKLKEFYKSCTDDYGRGRLKGTPFLEQVVKPLGGWDLLGTWEETSWDFNVALKKVQADFFAQALFASWVDVDRFDTTKHSIRIRPAGRSRWMNSADYWAADLSHHLDSYRKYIRTIGSFLVRDAKVTIDPNVVEAKLDQFVEDAVNVESNIVFMASHTTHINAKFTLDQFTQRTDNVINWAEQMAYMFNEAPVNGSTEVTVTFRDYYKKVTDMITGFPDADRNRILHNYLIWRVADVYAQEMSPEYTHAYREMQEDLEKKVSDFADLDEYCFSQTEKYMPDALGAMFVAEHFVDIHREQVTAITAHLKTVIEEQIEDTPWMDAETKAYAKDKVNLTFFELGHPDWMANHESVDALYRSLTVNVSDYYANVHSAARSARSAWSRLLTHGADDRVRWRISVFYYQLVNDWALNKIIVSSGALQSPFFDYAQPQYKNFGSLGSNLGRYLHQVIDESGRKYDQNGDDLGHGNSWWTDQTTDGYQAVKACVADAYGNATEEAWTAGGKLRTADFDPSAYAPTAIATVNGVRLALRGYRKWLSERGSAAEKKLPGLDLTADQMVFLSFAQASCRQSVPELEMRYAAFGYLAMDLRINIALNQLSEFTEAFQCQKITKMNPEKKCDLY